MRLCYVNELVYNVLTFRGNVWMYDVSLSSVDRLFEITAADTGKRSGTDDCACSWCRPSTDDVDRLL